MNRPTQQQISEAKAYIRSRVEAELSMKNNLDSLLRIAVSRLNAIASEYRMTMKEVVSSRRPQIKAKVKAVMDWLMFMIEETVDTLAVGAHKEDRDAVVSFVKREQYGRTFHDRLDGYVNDFVYNTQSSRSPIKAMSLLASFAVAEGWMYWWGLNGKRNRATGFFSFRGSSYPCDLCNSMVGYHPISEYVGIWHPHCKCYFVFV